MYQQLNQQQSLRTPFNEFDWSEQVQNVSYKRNKKKQSKFVVNFSLNFPLPPDKINIQKPVSGQFLISPSFPKKNLKIKLGSARTTQEPSSRKLSVTAESNQVTSARNQRKTSQKSANRSPNIQNRHSKNLSFPNSKSPSMILSKPNKIANIGHQSINLQILNSKIIETTDDDLIGYTNPSSELSRDDKQKEKLTKKQLPKKRQRTLMTPPFGIFKKSENDEAQLISQIKKIEGEANQKKKQLNFEYVRQKIMMQACARKIQRAWRNYKTKKLLHVYSHNFSIKYTNKMKDNWMSQPKILNVKSCGYRNGQNQMKRNLKQYKKSQFEEKEQKKDASVILEERKKAQLEEEIQKWQLLIKQLRKNKNVSSVLEKAEQSRNQLEKQSKRQRNQQQYKARNQNNQQIKFINTIQKIQDEQAKRQIQQALSKLQGYSKEEATFLRPQQKLQKIQVKMEDKNHEKKRKKIYSSQNTKLKEQAQATNAIQGQTTKQLRKLSKASDGDNSIISQIENQILGAFITNALLEGADEGKRRSILNQLKMMRELQRGQIISDSRYQNLHSKQQGICTNMESVKDYLENLVSFVFEQCPQVLIDNLNTPQKYNFNTISNICQQTNEVQNESVMPKTMFYSHWDYASQQIYFERKFENTRLQSERVLRLKKITKVFFESIFDSFNQCLQYERIYGKKGQPYPWETQVQRKFDILQTIDMIKPKVKSAFKKLSQMASIFCGMLIEDKSTRVSEQMREDIKQQRLNLFLEYDILNEGETWSNFNPWITDVMLKTSNLIYESIVLEVCCEIFRMKI